MARTHDECQAMVGAFRTAGVPLWVAYYRRALPRFLQVRDLLAAQAIGRLTSVHVQVTDRLATGAEATNWRFDPAVAGAGLFLDLASHCLDLLDFLVGPITEARGFAFNTGGIYAAEDVTSAAYRFTTRVAGTGIWNFHAGAKTDAITFTGSEGTLVTPVFTDGDVVLTAGVRGQDLPHSQSAARPSAADSNHRRRTARPGAMPVDRRVRRPHVMGHGPLHRRLLPARLAPFR